jgi:hypothetical protein
VYIYEVNIQGEKLIMQFINNQPFVDLSNFLDLQKLDSFEEEIFLGIAKSEEYISSASTPTKSILNSADGIAYQDVRNSAEKKYPFLSKRGIEWYSLLKGGESHGHVLFLRNIRNYPAEFKYKNCKDFCTYTPAAQHFKFLFDWIDEQKCFDEYGRVLFFISHPGQTGMTHRDNVGIEFLKDQYIWITGNKFPKSIFLYNNETDEKIYSTSRAVTFNNQLFHGTENRNPVASWSLRIDGKFSQELLDKAGIRNFFYPEEN